MTRNKGGRPLQGVARREHQLLVRLDDHEKLDALRHVGESRQEVVRRLIRESRLPSEDERMKGPLEITGELELPEGA